MKKIKKEHYGLIISDPLSRRNVQVDFIDPALYEFYSKKGFSFLFEEVESDTKKLKGPRDFKFNTDIE
jgi:hypothetical protein